MSTKVFYDVETGPSPADKHAMELFERYKAELIRLRRGDIDVFRIPQYDLAQMGPVHLGKLDKLIHAIKTGVGRLDTIYDHYMGYIVGRQTPSALKADKPHYWGA